MLSRKSAKKSMRFTLMVAGPSSSGKSTLINNIFQSTVVPIDNENRQQRFPENNSNVIQFKTNIYNFDTEVDGDKLSATVIETSGFADNIKNSYCPAELLLQIEEKFESVLDEETRIKRNPHFQDTRIHLLLYLLPPCRNGLKQLDIECIKRLSGKVNIIPVITKADSYTNLELQAIKSRILEQIKEHELKLFDFTMDEDEATLEACKAFPFAVICSNEDVMANGKAVKGRKYPWGTLECENKAISDLSILRTAILSTHISDLRDITVNELYEDFRTERLALLTSTSPIGASHGNFSISVKDLADRRLIDSSTVSSAMILSAAGEVQIPHSIINRSNACLDNSLTINQSTPDVIREIQMQTA